MIQPLLVRFGHHMKPKKQTTIDRPIILLEPVARRKHNRLQALERNRPFQPIVLGYQGTELRRRVLCFFLRQRIAAGIFEDPLFSSVLERLAVSG